ncbi:MAG TPA: hypothetical protein VNH15_07675 [Elusimicrobiota bacterium]|nr:hypothetical protein [Elusimicrobiota bacterium]
MNANKWISTILCGSLIVFSPGLGCYAALAGGVEAESGGMDAVGAINMPVDASIGESLPNLNMGNLDVSGVNLPSGDLSRADLSQGAPAPEHAVLSARSASVEPSRPAAEPSAASAAAAAAPEAIAAQAAPVAEKTPSSDLKGVLGAAVRRVSALAGIATPAKIPGGAQDLTAQVAQGRVEFDLAGKAEAASPVAAGSGIIEEVGTASVLGKPGSGNKQDDALTAANLPGAYAIDVIRQGKSYKGRITFNENYTFTAEDGAGKSAQGDWTLELGKLYLRRAYLSDGGSTGIELRIDVSGVTRSELGNKGIALSLSLVSLASSGIPKNYWVIAKEQGPSTDAVPAPGQAARQKAAGFWKTLPDKVIDIVVPFGQKSWKKRLIPILAMAATAAGAAFMPSLLPIMGGSMLALSGVLLALALPLAFGSKNKKLQYAGNLTLGLMLAGMELTLAAGVGAILGALAYAPVAAHAASALVAKSAVHAAAHPLLNALAPVFNWSLIGGALATIVGGTIFGTVGHFVDKGAPHKLWSLGSAIEARGAILSMVAGTLAGAFFGALHPAALPAVMAALAAHMTSARATLSAGRLALWLLGGFVVSDLGDVAAQRIIEGKEALRTGRPASPRRENLLDIVSAALFLGVPVAAMALAGFLAGGIVAAAALGVGAALGVAAGDRLAASPSAGPLIQYPLILAGAYLGALLAVHALLLL